MSHLFLSPARKSTFRLHRESQRTSRLCSLMQSRLSYYMKETPPGEEPFL
jgi:hypothetical protein